MESAEFISTLKELAANENVLAVSKDVNELRSKFDDYVLEEERKFQVSQLEAEEQGNPIPEMEGDFGKEEFYAIYNVYRDARKEKVAERKETEAKNLQAKRSIIKRLSEIITSEENIGAAFSAFKEIQEEWKTIGDIPRENRNDIQKDYSKLLEDFFYNINIYKQLKDHDFHRNHQLKLEIIQKLKDLQKEESNKEVESHLKQLQNDWEDIGPVPNEEWERLKEGYWTEVRSLYNRINRFYEDRRAAQQESLEKKQALVLEINAVIETQAEWDSTAIWEDKTKLILEIQERWKATGFGPKKDSDTIWKEFRAVCDTFFDAKKAFFGKINEKFDSVAEKKKELIAKALELKDSTDWKETSNQLVQLQKRWKQLGHAGRKNEQKLWKSFRAACDAFFDSRQKTFENQDKEYEGNLALKEAVITELQAYEVTDDKAKSIADLREFSNRFNAVGHVPMKSKNDVYNAFKKAMDDVYGKLKMDGDEKEKILFQAKIETLKASPNASRLFGDLKFDLRKEIDSHKKEITQLENNLGFFAKSKGADALKKDVEKKVSRANAQIDLIKMKLKLIPNE